MAYRIYRPNARFITALIAMSATLRRGSRFHKQAIKVELLLLVCKYLDPHFSDSYRVDTLEQTETHQAPTAVDCVPDMGFKAMLHRSTLAEYSRKIKSAPREVILSPPLLISAVLYATAAIPLSESIGPRLFFPKSLTRCHSMGSRFRIYGLFSTSFSGAFRYQLQIRCQFHEISCLSRLRW